VTMVFTGLVVFEFVKLYVVRWTKGTQALSNPWLAVAVTASLALQLVILYTPLNEYFGIVPLGIDDWLLLGIVVLVGTPALFLVGWFIRRSLGDEPATDQSPEPAPSRPAREN
jgi:Ca2+-transporting ATPase